MISVVKSLKVVNDLSDQFNDLCVGEDNANYIKVFEMKNVDINLDAVQTTTNDGDVDDLSKCFEKKLDIKTIRDADEVLQVSRGPQGGKPTYQKDDVPEDEPPLKFVRPYEVANEGRSHHQTYPKTSVVPNSCYYPPSYAIGDRLIRNNDAYREKYDNFLGSKFNEISSEYNGMRAGDVFNECGIVGVEPAHFSTLNSKYVYDEHGQIIQQNNERKFDIRGTIPQTQNSSFPAFFIPPTLFHKNISMNGHLSNPMNKNQNQFRLNIQNFQNSINLSNHNRPNVPLTNGGPWITKMKQRPTAIHETNCFQQGFNAVVYQQVMSDQNKFQYKSNKESFQPITSIGNIPIDHKEGVLNMICQSLIGNYIPDQMLPKTSISGFSNKGNTFMNSPVKQNTTENDMSAPIGNKGQLEGTSTKRANDMTKVMPTSFGKNQLNETLLETNSCQTTNERMDTPLRQPTTLNIFDDFISPDEESELLESFLGLDNSTLLSLLEEYQGYSSQENELFKKSEPILTRPQVLPSHENYINSSPDSFTSSPHGFYYAESNYLSPDNEPNSLSTCSDYNYQESFDSRKEQLVIHPDLDSLFLKDSSDLCFGLSGTLDTPSKTRCPISDVFAKPTSDDDCSNNPLINDYITGSENSNEDHSETDNQLTYSKYTDEELIRQDEDGDNILHIAVINDKPEIIQEVLKAVKYENDLRKIIIDAKNELSQTPLCLAVVENQPIMIKSLIEYGAKGGVPILSRKDKSFTRPLHFAASKGHLWMECLRELLACPNIDVNSLDSEGKTPLLCSIKGHGTLYKGKTINSIPSIELLVEKGADLNKSDGCFNMTALHYAINSKSLDLVSCLVSLATTRCNHNIPFINIKSNTKGSKVPSLGVSTLTRMLNTKTGTGYSALHLAVSLNMKNDLDQLKLIQLLLSKGADPSCKNSEGHLPRELTKNQKVIELLKGIGLRRKPSSSPNEVTGSFHHSPGIHSPRSVTSQDRMTLTSGQSSPSNQIPSPIHHFN